MKPEQTHETEKSSPPLGNLNRIFRRLRLCPACSISGEEIKSLIGGKRVYLSTPLRIELPLFYKSDGTVVGNLSGFSMARMFAPKEAGRWWVEGARICQKWPTWYKGKQFCFTISKTGENKIALVAR